MNNSLDRYLAGEAPLHPERLELPTRENAEKTSVISLKEGKLLGDLMTAHSSVTLTKDNTSHSLNISRPIKKVKSFRGRYLLL